jgi:hypothetical protein
MASLYISKAQGSNEQVVVRPRPADALGAALRGAFGAHGGLPSDLAHLLLRLDRLR